jgi:hypothetical protein
MNELFQVDPELPELFDKDGVAYQQLRFNSDRRAFLNSNFHDFFYLFWP